MKGIRMTAAIVVVMMLIGVANWIVGCSSDGINAFLTGRYWPLAFGDQWTYRTYCDGRRGSSRMWTESEKTIGGSTVYPQHKTENSADLLRIYPLSDTKDGISIMGTDIYRPSPGTIRFSPPLLIPARMEPGDSSTQTVTATGTGVYAAATGARLDVEFVGKETLTIPAGTFQDCLQFTINQTVLDAGGRSISDGQEPSRTWWLAENVGLVKATDSNNDLAELVSARVGGRSYP